jgi:excisionase family DNA binding protein
VTPKARDVLSVDEISRRTGLHRDTIKRHIRAGEFPGYHLGGRYLIPIELYEDWKRGRWRSQPNGKEHAA